MEECDAGKEAAESILELKIKLADPKNAIELSCKDKDVVLLLGNTGSGKSVLYNYLLDIPLKECSAADIGVQGLPNQKYIKVNTTKKHVDTKYSEIGHTTKSLTETPVISVLDEMALCDCPGFKDNRGATHLLANTVKITRALKSSRSCKIIVVVTYGEVAENRITSLREISDRISRMFRSEDLFRQHCKSIRFLITKLLKFHDGELGKAEQIQSILFMSEFENLRRIAANEVLIYDPLSRNDRIYSPIPTREELIEAIKSIPSISNPIKVFGMGFSDSEELAIQEYQKTIIECTNDLITKKEWLKAAPYYLIVLCLEVLEHETVKTACADLKKKVEDVLSKMRDEYEKKAMKEDAEKAKRIFEEFWLIYKAFQPSGSDAVLKKMWDKYIAFKKKTTIFIGVTGSAMSVYLGSAVPISFPPLIPVLVVCAGIATAAGYAFPKFFALSRAEAPKTKEDEEGK